MFCRTYCSGRCFAIPPLGGCIRPIRGTHLFGGVTLSPFPLHPHSVPVRYNLLPPMKQLTLTFCCDILHLLTTIVSLVFNLFYLVQCYRTLFGILPALHPTEFYLIRPCPLRAWMTTTFSTTGVGGWDPSHSTYLFGFLFTTLFIVTLFTDFDRPPATCFYSSLPYCSLI